jgi:N,N-dimethylformamidase beta subunit-like, C-terminal
MKDHESSYIAAIVTIIASISIACGIIWVPLGIHISQEVMTKSTTKTMGILTPIYNGHELNAVQETKVPSSLPSLLKVVPQLTPTKTSTAQLTVRTQRSNISISRQTAESNLYGAFSMDMKSTKQFLNSRSFTITRNTSPILPERIAYVAPTFTIAAYNHRFYVFYRLEAKVPLWANVTTGLNLLTSKVIKLPSRIIKHAFLAPSSNIEVITDQDVDSGSVFTNNNPNSKSKYDVLILGHQEYVTQKEYDNLRHFVANGGTLILLDGNVFYAQVRYDRYSHSITLIKGHGWAYNGQSAWRSINERWANETSEWIGSNYLCYSCDVTFANDPWKYKHHEEQYITNRDDRIFINYDAQLITKHHVTYKPIIATYELHYKKGRVIVFGLYTEDILNNPIFDKYFVTLLMRQLLS